MITNHKMNWSADIVHSCAAQSAAACELFWNRRGPAMVPITLLTSFAKSNYA